MGYSPWDREELDTIGRLALSRDVAPGVQLGTLQWSREMELGGQGCTVGGRLKCGRSISIHIADSHCCTAYSKLKKNEKETHNKVTDYFKDEKKKIRFNMKGYVFQELFAFSFASAKYFLKYYQVKLCLKIL